MSDNPSLRGVSGANDEAISLLSFFTLNGIASVALLPRNDGNSRNDGDPFVIARSERSERRSNLTYLALNGIASLRSQ